MMLSLYAGTVDNTRGYGSGVERPFRIRKARGSIPRTSNKQSFIGPIQDCKLLLGKCLLSAHVQPLQLNLATTLVTTPLLARSNKCGMAGLTKVED